MSDKAGDYFYKGCQENQGRRKAAVNGNMAQRKLEPLGEKKVSLVILASSEFCNPENRIRPPFILRSPLHRQLEALPSLFSQSLAIVKLGLEGKERDAGTAVSHPRKQHPNKNKTWVGFSRGSPTSAAHQSLCGGSVSDTRPCHAHNDIRAPTGSFRGSQYFSKAPKTTFPAPSHPYPAPPTPLPTHFLITLLRKCLF